jgi:hypothetical protein
MDLEFTVRINGEDVAVEIVQIRQNVWQATAVYHGTRYHATGETASKAHETLSRMCGAEKKAPWWRTGGGLLLRLGLSLEHTGSPSTTNSAPQSRSHPGRRPWKHGSQSVGAAITY